MLIDWFTVGAQIVNFLILIALLKRFLYGPILRAMDRREERIAERLQEAEQKRDEAEKEAERYREQRRELEEEREQRLQEAREDAGRRREELVQEAKDEADEVRQAWRESVRREREDFVRRLRERAGSEVIGITRKALADLAEAELGSQLVRVFVGRLRDLDDDQRRTCSRAAEAGPVAVRSSFELDGSGKGQITKAFRAACGAEAEVEYRTDPELPFGVELVAGDLRLAWGGESYLDALERRVGELLEEGAEEEPEAQREADSGGGEGKGERGS